MDKIVSNPLFLRSRERILSAKFLNFDAFAGTTFFITGATGLLGTVLIDALLSAKIGVKIFALTRNANRARKRFPQFHGNPNLQFIEQDAREEIRLDVPVNFIVCGASNAHPIAYGSDPAGTIEINIFGAINAMKLARKNPRSRTAFLSTVEIYGENTTDKSAFAENDCGYINCNTVRACYPESKRLAECLFQIEKQTHNLDFVSPRFCRLFGPTMTNEDSKASAQFLRNAVDGNDIVLKSAGTQKFSYGYAPDAISALLLLIQKGASGNAYNVAPEAIELREFAKLCADTAGTNLSFEIGSATTTETRGASVVKNAILDDSRLRSLGWFPQWTLREAVNETVEILRSENEN